MGNPFLKKVCIIKRKKNLEPETWNLKMFQKNVGFCSPI